MIHKTKLTKAQQLRLKNGAWFIAVRGSYLPYSPQGWLTYIPFIAYLVYAWIVAFNYTGNSLKAVLWIVPNWVAATVIMTWIAKRKS